MLRLALIPHENHRNHEPEGRHGQNNNGRGTGRVTRPQRYAHAPDRHGPAGQSFPSIRLVRRNRRPLSLPDGPGGASGKNRGSKSHYDAQHHRAWPGRNRTAQRNGTRVLPPRQSRQDGLGPRNGCVARLDARQDAGLLRVIDPRNNASYFLVREAEYETVREVLEDEQRQRTIHAVGLRNAIGRMGEMS